MPDVDHVSDALHQLFFGWFSFYPTLCLVCIGALGAFLLTAYWKPKVVLFMAMGAVIVTLPQLLPFSSQFTAESRELGVTIWGNRHVFLWLVIGSELMWWPPVALAYWLGKKVYRHRVIPQGEIFE